MTEPAPSHSVRVFLTNGCELNTEDYFGADEDPHQEIFEHIEDRESVWKGIGTLCVHFKYIVGFDVKELYHAEPGKLATIHPIKEGN